MHHRPAILLLITALLALLAACDGGVQQSCEAIGDCYRGEACLEGTCVQAGGGGGEDVVGCPAALFPDCADDPLEPNDVRNGGNGMTVPSQGHEYCVDGSFQPLQWSAKARLCPDDLDTFRVLVDDRSSCRLEPPTVTVTFRLDEAADCEAEQVIVRPFVNGRQWDVDTCEQTDWITCEQEDDGRTRRITWSFAELQQLYDAFFLVEGTGSFGYEVEVEAR